MGPRSVGGDAPFLDRWRHANNLGEEGTERVQAAFGANYAKLAAVKNKYDPTNFFHMNHNIKPTKAAQAMS